MSLPITNNTVINNQQQQQQALDSQAVMDKINNKLENVTLNDQTLSPSSVNVDCNSTSITVTDADGNNVNESAIVNHSRANDDTKVTNRSRSNSNVSQYSISSSYTSMEDFEDEFEDDISPASRRPKQKNSKRQTDFCIRDIADAEYGRSEIEHAERG